jgi:hypothetical protein
MEIFMLQAFAQDLNIFIPEKKETHFFGVLIQSLAIALLKVTDTMWGMEIRPIMGFENDNWLVSFNPILDIPLSKGGMHAAAFEPSFKIMRRINNDLELGVEHYSGMGPISNLQGWKNQEHTTYFAA